MLFAVSSPSSFQPEALHTGQLTLPDKSSSNDTPYGYRELRKFDDTFWLPARVGNEYVSQVWAPDGELGKAHAPFRG